MANSFGSLYVGSAGLQSAQNALNTTSNNLANVNTTGYVRQQVLFSDKHYVTFNTTASISPQQSGLGVQIGDVLHVRDMFYDRTYRTTAGRQTFYATTFEAVDEVYTFYQELQGKAFQSTLTDLKKSFEEFAKAPTDSVQHNLVIQKANLFISRAEAVQSGLEGYQLTLNSKISLDIDKINKIGNQIYELNQEISEIEGGHVETAMTLRDQRDNLLDELAGYADITYKEDASGRVKVTLEGVEFVTTAGCYEIGKREDTRTGFITPYWKHTSNEKKQQYDDVFDFSIEISSEMQTDVGELKALLLARGDRIASYKDIEGLTSQQYNNSTPTSIAAGTSVMLQAQAQLDQLVHQMVTAINDVLCPNTTLEELNQSLGVTGTTYPLTVTTANGRTIEITADTKVLDSKNCSTGVGGELPPQELFTRSGTERYTEVTTADGKTYYVYNEEDPNDSSKRYTLSALSVNEALEKQATLLPHLTQNGGADYDLANKLVDLWNQESFTLDPDDTNRVNFIDYYNNMVGAFGTIGSVYETAATELSGATEAADLKRLQVMGVSADEELTKMVKYQNAYNASSRFINVVNEMIGTLINGMGA